MDSGKVLKFELEDARSLISGLGSDLTEKESELKPILPIDDTYGLRNDLESVADDWLGGRKSVRAIPVVNVVGGELNREIPTATKRFLLCLDAQVNALDDIIDTRNLTKQDRISFTSVIAQSIGFLLQDIPDSMSPEALQDYYVKLFQIPIVEGQKLSEFEQAMDQETRIEAAFQVYRYRARDIDGFINAFGDAKGLTTNQFHRLVEDLRSYRARRLLYKDLADVERDQKDGDRTIVLSYIDDAEDQCSVTKLIEAVAEKFEYSDRGRQHYGEILTHLERQTREPLENKVQRAISKIV